MASTIFVKIPGKGTCCFEFQVETCTVNCLLRALNARSISCQGQVISWGGKVFSRSTMDVPLARFGVIPGSTIELLLPLKGGAQLGKMVKGRSKDKTGAESAAELAAKMAWLQEQAKRRVQARDALQAQKDKAVAEAELSRVNNLKILATMRNFMRDEKLGSLRKELETLSALHEETIRRKDGMLLRLMDNHDFAYDQHSACAMSHMDHLERLIRLQDQRLLLVERQFEADLKVGVKCDVCR